MIDTAEPQIKNQWKPLEKYSLDNGELEILLGDSKENVGEIMKKIPVNKYVIIDSGKKVEDYFSFIDSLKEKGLDVGRGDAEYGWRMPIVKKKIQLKIFRRHQNEK